MNKEHGIYLTSIELTNLNRIFDIVSEDALKANHFTDSDIEAVYSVVGKTKVAVEEAELDGDIE